MNVLNYIIIFFILLNLSCSTLDYNQPLNPKIYYRNDLEFSFKKNRLIKNNQKFFSSKANQHRYRGKLSYKEDQEYKFYGVGVLPEQSSYNIEINNHARLDLFTVTSCHEEKTSERPDRGFFKKDGKVKFEYIPTIERGKACPLYISAYNKKNKNGFGIILFENERYKLKAKLFCNGETTESNGVSICQSREGLMQSIKFNEPVKLVDPVVGAATKKEPCTPMDNDNKYQFTFRVPARECWYGFIGKKSGDIHQLFTIGYEDIIIRN